VTRSTLTASPSPTVRVPRVGGGVARRSRFPARCQPMSDCEPASAATPAAVWRRRGVILPGASGYVGDLRERGEHE